MAPGMEDTREGQGGSQGGRELGREGVREGLGGYVPGRVCTGEGAEREGAGREGTGEGACWGGGGSSQSAGSPPCALWQCMREGGQGWLHKRRVGGHVREELKGGHERVIQGEGRQWPGSKRTRK
jgi:hypothetical protein